jgi:hypothetical protein
MNGVREFVIMKQTGHKTVATLRRYIRSGETFRENAAEGLGIYAGANAREDSLPGSWRASCQARDLRPSFKMAASVSAGSVGMSDFCAARDRHFGEVLA